MHRHVAEGDHLAAHRKDGALGKPGQRAAPASRRDDHVAGADHPVAEVELSVEDRLHLATHQLDAGADDGLAQRAHQLAVVDLAVVGKPETEARARVLEQIAHQGAAQAQRALPARALDQGSLLRLGERQLQRAADRVRDVDSGEREQLLGERRIERAGGEAEVEQRPGSVRLHLRAQDAGSSPRGLGAWLAPLDQRDAEPRLPQPQRREKADRAAADHRCVEKLHAALSRTVRPAAKGVAARGPGQRPCEPMSVRLQILRVPGRGEPLPLPAYATEGSAGLDLRADQAQSLAPGERALVPTGLRIAVPAGYEAQVRPRSGLALRDGVTCLNTPGTIDSDYRGEVGVILINLGQKPVTIARGDRIAQLLLAQVARAELIEADGLPESGRGEGGFGHTGR